MKPFLATFSRLQTTQFRGLSSIRYMCASVQREIKHAECEAAQAFELLIQIQITFLSDSCYCYNKAWVTPCVAAALPVPFSSTSWRLLSLVSMMPLASM